VSLAGSVSVSDHFFKLGEGVMAAAIHLGFSQCQGGVWTGELEAV
jgi:hypothetical protein